jgi:amino acid adenylation domain-containing protein
MSEPLAPNGAEVFPLTSTQRGILAESLLHERGMYVEQIVGELDEPLDIGHFRSAWEHAAAAFDALRLRLSWAQGNAASQTIAPSVEVPFHVEDLREQSGTPRARIDAFIERDRLEGFDLSTVPLMRVSVLLLDHAAWAFVWTIHHTIIDGGSYAVVLRHVFDSYDRLSHGRPPDAPPSPPFKAFLTWLQAQEATAGVRHFEMLLAGFHEPTRLPLQGGRSEFLTGRSDEMRVRLGPAESEAIVSAATDSGTTVETLVQFAWGLLLGCYVDEDDVVFGATWSGRPDTIDGTDLLVGPCLNTLPIRINVAGAPTVRSALRALRDQHLAMRPFQHTPLLAVSLAPELRRQIFRTNVVFEHERFDAALTRKDERWTRRRLSARSQTNYPLNLSAYFDKGELAVDLEYSRGLYTERAANQLLLDYTRLLTGIAHHLDAAPADVCSLEPGILEELTTGEARREQVRSQPSPIDRILRNGDGCPDAVAVRDVAGRQVTYAELARRVLGLAQELREHGVARRDLVGILLPRSIDAIVSMLAVHEVGAAFLNLDPGDPPARLEYMVTDTRLVRVLVNGETAGTLKSATGLEVRADTARRVPAGGRIRSDPDPSDIAYVVYTSGSTGHPKGVCITCSALANHAASVIEAFGLRKDDRVLMFSALNFDVSLEEMLPTLLVGASVVLSHDAAIVSAKLFFDAVERSGVTVLNLPTAFWHHLVHSEGSGAWPGSVRLLIVGDERVSSADLRVFRQAKTGHIRFLNGYGSTETTITSTVYDESEDDHDGETVPIGRPLNGHSHFVLDRRLRPVPPGVVGQLYVGGAGLALGYLRRPELTAQRFLPHPFRSDARLYATGDLVRRTERGNYVFVDRIDDQVKLRGFRIELGEIAACLEQHAGVAEAVVVLHRPQGGEPELRGFVVARDRSVSAGMLRDHVAAALPRHMIPRISIVDELPKTPAGKIDRPALAARAVPQGQSSPTAPRTPVEDMLVAIWSDVLGIDRVGIYDDFFELGGHSLLAARLTQQMTDIFWLKLPLRLLFDAPTIATMAAVIERRLDAKQSEEPATDVLEINTSGTRPPFFFLHAALKGNGFYCFNLARHLGEDQPLYALAPLGLDGSETPPTVEEIAAKQLQIVRRVQPRGPYYLGGFCDSGAVAFELARMLKTVGEPVGILVVIESFINDRDWVVRFSDRVARALARVARLSSAQRLNAFHAVRPWLSRLARIPDSMAREGAAVVVRKMRSLVSMAVKRWRARAVDSGGPDTAITRQNDLSNAVLHRYLRAVDGFLPQRYDGEVVALKAEASPIDSTAAWRRVAPRLRVQMVKGDHNTCITTRVDSLGAQLRDFLREAQEGAHAAPASQPGGAPANHPDSSRRV